MKTSTIDKIRAIANDARGDPQMRARAQEKLRELGAKDPPPKEKVRTAPNRLHPGMRVDPLHEMRMFNDLSQWRKAQSGNLTRSVYRHGISYRIVLFKHKRTDTYGWMRADDTNGEMEFSTRFHTLQEAHADAWNQIPIT